MGLITEPGDYDGTTATLWSILNTIKNALYGLVNGNIDNANIKTGAAIDPEKISGAATTLTGSGTQSQVRPLEFTADALCLDTSSNSRSNSAVIADGAITIALQDAAKRIQRYSYANTSAANASIATITGGVVDRVYQFYIDNQDAAQTPIFVHTNADATNNIKTKTGANRVFTAALKGTITMVYGDMNGSGVNQWWEI